MRTIRELDEALAEVERLRAAVQDLCEVLDECVYEIDTRYGPPGSNRIDREMIERARAVLAKAKIDPLHPNGRCRCAGEGQCEWCQRTEAREELDGIAEVLDAAGVPQVTDGPDGQRWTLGLGARVEHVIAERDEARAEVEELRAQSEQRRAALERLNNIYRSEHEEPGPNPPWLAAALAGEGEGGPRCGS